VGWLIAYDISCVRRWRRIHRLLREEGSKLQYSLFWADIDAREARRLADRLNRIVDDVDDVRLYNLPDGARVELLGPSQWPSGVSDAAALRFSDFEHRTSRHP
jgi:CRISPR-associated protein Cas2